MIHSSEPSPDALSDVDASQAAISMPVGDASWDNPVSAEAQKEAVTSGAGSRTRTPLSELVHEVLNPEGLGKRTVREWRSLHRTFFSFFATTGPANESERKAWSIALDAFNRNLVVFQGRVSRVVPMTFQDCLDSIDSFRQDGLHESAQRDIAWQPKKILLLLTAMMGRIVAGWEADKNGCEDSELPPFRRYLISENRKASFLGHVFPHDSRFTVLDYHGAGLKPMVQPFPHLANALLENGLQTCEYHSAAEIRTLPTLRLRFARPVRVAGSVPSVTTVDIAVLRQPLPPPASPYDSSADLERLELSATTLEKLQFNPKDPWEQRAAAVERLFALATNQHAHVGAWYRGATPAAKNLANTLGRTEAERFAIEQFFALGFRSGSGNEPWRETAANGTSEPSPEKIKESWKQLEHWKGTLFFFAQADQARAAEAPGARLRQELLQPRSNVSSPFLALYKIPFYAPLMRTLLMADEDESWYVGDQDLRVFARCINGNVGRVLLEGAKSVSECAQSLANNESRGLFCFECALGIFLAIPAGEKAQVHHTHFGPVRDALRLAYEQRFGSSLASAPSAGGENPLESISRTTEAKRRIEQIEQSIWALVEGPLTESVTPSLRESRGRLVEEYQMLERRSAPAIQLESLSAYEKSVLTLAEWIARDRTTPTEAAPGKQLALTLADIRILAEEGKIAEAIHRASDLQPSLSKKKRERLAPLFAELSSFVVAAIDELLAKGQREAATALGRKQTTLLEGTPALEEFTRAVRTRINTLARSKPAEPVGVREETSHELRQRARQAEDLLRDHADELAIAENALEFEFLRAVAAGLGAKFRRREKLENRLQRLTQWGGREPHMSALKLLRSVFSQ